MKHNLLALIVALPLLACTPAGDKAETGEAIAQGAGVGDGPTGRVGPSVARGADKGPIPSDIDEGLNPANEAAPKGEPAAKPTMIPAQFHGRWGLTANDCKPEFVSAAKGLMVVNDSRLTFYESRGTLDRIDAWTPANRFTANYGFSGEGMTWERVITLERTGSTLRRTEKGGDEGPVDLRYTACPTT
ncbi:hypothetical protein [Sphingomonas glaciei]|uniref:Lipoprotein n=1 Tax=Sphingomonas glaciei TaxID=2938948 RepID=A0ABY5MXK5_9SPHN|nr:hypothetical protein [Sphingomonas glaciei]UUR09038.1 hypothetical protein M1K48_05300 [Sphingomonas glaciei]